MSIMAIESLISRSFIVISDSKSDISSSSQVDLPLFYCIIFSITHDYFSGDSTLDNKFWFTDRAPALNEYENILHPPVSRMDVAYWINAILVKNGMHQYAAINCAGDIQFTLIPTLN